MSTSIEGFYAAYFTGSASQGFAMLVFEAGAIVGVDAAGVRYDGVYSNTNSGLTIKLCITIPPNTFLVQGVSSGSQGDKSELNLHLSEDFTSRSYIRIDTKYGPVNTRFVKLRDFH